MPVGPNFPGTTASLANAGTSENAEAWVSPGNIVSDNATEAQITAATYDNGDISQLLVASNFGFAIPNGASIFGIVVEIDRRVIAGSAADFRVQLAKGTTFANLVGNNKASASAWPSTSTVATYGSSSDLWGTTWTEAEIESSSFAVMLSVSATANNVDIGVDFIRVTVHYGFTQSLSGSLSFTGSITKRPGKSLTGGLSFAGSITKSAGKALSGAISPAGALVKQTARALSGGLSFSGALTSSRVYLKSLAGSLSFGGALSKRPGKALAGGLSFSGAVTKRVGKSLTGGLSFSGALTKRAGKALAGALSFSGALAKRAGKSLAGGLSFSGALTKRAGKALAGALSFAGNLVTEFPPPGGTQYFKELAGSLSFSGGLAKETRRSLAGALSFSGALTKRTARALAGGLSFAGNLATRISVKTLITFNASLSFSGQLLGGSLRIAGSALEYTRLWISRRRSGLRPPR